MSIYGFLPERFLALGVSILLVQGSFARSLHDQTKSTQQDSIRPLSFGLLIGVLAIVVSPRLSTPVNGSFEAVIYDGRSQTLKLLRVVASMGCILALRKGENQNAMLRLFALLGSMVMVTAKDLMVFYLALELQSLSLYVLASSARGSAYSTEAGLKYFRLGAFASGLFLLGSSLVYGFLGTTRYDTIGQLVGTYSNEAATAPGASLFVPNSTWLLIGFGLITTAVRFKLAAVPFHRWSPDVLEGAPTTSSRFLASVPKVAAFGALVRMAYRPFYTLWFDLLPVIAIRSALSMIVAALSALGQRRMKRFLAYSGIGHMGFRLMGLASGTLEGRQASLVYLSIYIVGSIGIWAAVTSSSSSIASGRYFTDIVGLARRHAAFACVFAVARFSRAGVPPMAGFFAKLSVFFSAREGANYILAVIAVLASVVGAFYYLRLIKIRYFDRPGSGFSTINFKGANTGMAWARSFSRFVTVFRLINPALIVELAKYIGTSIQG